MKSLFEPRRGHDEAARNQAAAEQNPDREEWDEDEDEDDDSSPVLPAGLLDRHGALVLDPARAAAVAGYPPPRPTVYRATTLLVPDDLLKNQDFIGAVNKVLKPIGIELIPPERDVDEELDTSDPDQEVLEELAELARLPRPAVLVPLPGYRRPVTIDAWAVLQTLRAAAAPANPDRDEAAADQDEVRLDRELVDLIGLEHLLTGSTVMTGSPSGSPGGGGIGGGSDNGGLPGINDSYVFSGDGRTPVMVLANPPKRRSEDECDTDYGRRPVVAVLDTGVRAHPWLDMIPDGAGGYMPSIPDSFVATDPNIQREIFRESQWAANAGSTPRRVIRDAWDKPVADNPLTGELNEALGHSTFIAGILRQVAPDATVLAVRVMGSDDILYESDLICGLRHLAKRIAIAQPGDLAAEVDVLSLSVGYYSESSPAQMASSGLWRVIKVLISLGVVVLVAAGNSASRRRFYPAAFALEPVPPGQVPVISEGALNVNGTKAMFSNDGHWVTSWAAGAHVLSTYPVDIDGSRAPELRTPVNRDPAGQWPQGKEALDPDDFSAGFALWSGTSFSAPYGAALVVKELLADAQAAGGALRLNLPGKAARRARAEAAYNNVPTII